MEEMQRDRELPKNAISDGVRKTGQQAGREGRRKIAREDREKSVEGARTILRIFSLSLVRKIETSIVSVRTVGRTIGTVKSWERGNESKGNDATPRRGAKERKIDATGCVSWRMRINVVDRSGRGIEGSVIERKRTKEREVALAGIHAGGYT